MTSRHQHFLPLLAVAGFLSSACTHSGSPSSMRSPASNAAAPTTQTARQKAIAAEIDASPGLIALRATSPRVVGYPLGPTPVIEATCQLPSEWEGADFVVIERPWKFSAPHAPSADDAFFPLRLYVLAERLSRYEQGGVEGFGFVPYYKHFAMGSAMRPATFSIRLHPANYNPGRYRFTVVAIANGKLIARSTAPVDVEWYDVRYPPR